MKRTRARVGKGLLPGRSRAGGGRGAKPALVTVCRCEEVTEDEVRSVIRAGYHTLEEVKRILRTGMGHCQGRGCLKIIARLIQEETGIAASSQKMPIPRPPLKPLPIGMLAAHSDEQ